MTYRTHPPTVNYLALMKMMLMTILTIASMELPPHPPLSKEVHNAPEETVGQSISTVETYVRFLVNMARKTPVFKV
jgi:hypothetical protein